MGRYPYTGFFGRLKKDDVDIITEALDSVDALHLAERFYKELSDGEKQKILISRALAQQQELIVLDEPTSHLDIRHRIEVVNILSRLCLEKGTTVILSLHDIDLAIKGCQTILMIKNGAISAKGTPEEIVRQGVIQELYGISDARYDDLLGSVELSGSNSSNLFVVGGGGTGTPVFRALHHINIGMDCGVLHQSDVDAHVAEGICNTVVTESNFTPISDQSYNDAYSLMKRYPVVIDTGFPIGEMNIRNKSLLLEAVNEGLTVYTLRKKKDNFYPNSSSSLPSLYEKCLYDADSCDFLIIDLHSGITHFHGFHKLFQRITSSKPIFLRSSLDDEAKQLMDKMGISLTQYVRIERYILAGGLENFISKALYIANNWNNCNYEVPGPCIENQHCLYEPLGPVADEVTYLNRIRGSDLPVIGVLVHQSHFKRKDMKTADALYNTLLRLGAQPLVLVTNTTPPLGPDSMSFHDALRYYFTVNGKPVVAAIINTIGMSVSVLSSPGSGRSQENSSVFELTGVPVFQGMETYYSYDQWLAAPAGLDSMMLSCCVYQPEFDGQIVTFPICTREAEKSPYGKREIFHPIKDRVEKLCQLAIKWGRLRKIQASDKKIALILHNMPPRNDTIGCAYQLDTAASIYGMVNALNEEGVLLDYPFKDGEDIIIRIIDGLSNDGRWLPEDEMLRRSVDTLSEGQYRIWFDTYGQAAKTKMTDDWGEPPGDFMAVDDKFLIPGILNGNVFIGLQPPRALEKRLRNPTTVLISCVPTNISLFIDG